MSAVLVESGPDKGAIWHFGEPNNEQKALAKGAGWADLSHRGVISITGKDRLTWLHALTTQHLEKLEVTTWVDALILDTQGHVIDQLFLVDDGQSVWLHLEKERVAPVIEYLNKMKFMLEVDVKDESDNYAVLRAPGMADAIGGPYALVPRNELKETTDAFNKSHTQVGIWALEAERVAAGRARLLFEVDHKSIPNELGFLNKSVHIDGSMVAMPEHGSKVFLDDKEVGFIGSLARHYELGPIALAVVKRNVALDATLICEGVTATQEELALR
jgi:hypothetical protein